MKHEVRVHASISQCHPARTSSVYLMTHEMFGALHTLSAKYADTQGYV